MDTTMQTITRMKNTIEEKFIVRLVAGCFGKIYISWKQQVSSEVERREYWIDSIFRNAIM